MTNLFKEIWLFSPSQWYLHGVSTHTAAVLRLFSAILFVIFTISLLPFSFVWWAGFLLLPPLAVSMIATSLLYPRFFSASVVMIALALWSGSSTHIDALCSFLWILWGLYQLLLCGSAPSYKGSQRVRSHSLKPDLFYGSKIGVSLFLWVSGAFLPESIFESFWALYSATSLWEQVFQLGLFMQHFLMAFVPIFGLLSASMYYTHEEKLRCYFEKTYAAFGFVLFLCLSTYFGAALSVSWLSWLLWTTSWGLWWPRRPMGFEKEVLFYDGGCAFCQACCRLIYAEERALVKMEFSSSIEEREKAFNKAKNIDHEDPKNQKVPQALALLSDQGNFYSGSDAVFAILRRMGGVWRALAYVQLLLPRAAWQWGYSQVASMRYRISMFTSSCKQCQRD